MIVALGLLVSFSSLAQKKSTKTTTASTPMAAKVDFDESLYNSIKWRSIGPFRGGRSAAVTGVPGKPNLFYMGATGGGVWRTQDGGQTWENISDGFFGGSIGAVAVSEYDNNVIYVGGGEKTVRGNVSYGHGMWKSVDAGKTWTDIGFKNARHIPRIRIHPKNPDLVYAAVLGDLFKSSDERGVYRSKDGGKTWEKILFANADAGAVDLVFDPSNPRIMYASTWRIRRTPYSLDSGGEGSALWKTTDGGDTWKNISGNKGLPEGVWGISGVAVSHVNSNRVWTIIENEKGGLYRSDDGGENWSLVNGDRSMRQRAWYYTRLYADTQDENIVWVLNVSYHKSTDGGRTFTSANAPHGDHHDLWIAPEDNQRMIIGDDGGAQVSFDAGENWSTYMNQPTSQFYRVTTDNAFPYRIYGAQQDNSTLRIKHRTDGGGITESDWETSAGGESAWLAVDPTDDDIVFGGSYGGLLEKMNHRTKEEQRVDVYPENPMGYGAEGMKYRFQWNFPIFFSPHDPKKLYALSDRVHVTTNGGRSWTHLSGDLTRNDPSKLKSSGGPITQDNTSVEYYCTLFTGCESPFEKDLIWVGSDDGLINMSKDGGKTWTNVSPQGAPEWIMWNSIDPDPFTKGGAYITGTRYKLGDYKSYIYKTEDYGKTWKYIGGGIPDNHFSRVTRADQKRKGLLYCGTEGGMYISFDDGANWKSFQLNLPIVPITDLTIKNDNLIAATQGRSFWLIDDITPLHQLNDQVAKSEHHLYTPTASYRMGSGFSFGRVSRTAGQNHPGGVIVHYYLKEVPEKEEVKLSFYESDGDLIREFSSKAKERADKLEVKKGGNSFVWNMRYPDAKRFEGMIMWAANMAGAKAVPGAYSVKLTVGDKSQQVEFDLMKDPRSSATQEDLQAQFDFINGINNKITEAHQTIIDIRDIRKQINAYTELLKDNDEAKDLLAKAKEINAALTKVEEELYQTKNRSGQDPLNYPIKLTNKLGSLASQASTGDNRPTAQSGEVRQDLTVKIDAQLSEYKKIRDNELPKFNELVRQKAIDPIMVKKPARS
ncbi:MAG: glycosyl hydrolase [Saprospiraceae bacterium]|nr:glycosyl hydrolase [Saprospiraceae bacterium]